MEKIINEAEKKEFLMKKDGLSISFIFNQIPTNQSSEQLKIGQIIVTKKETQQTIMIDLMYDESGYVYNIRFSENITQLSRIFRDSRLFKGLAPAEKSEQDYSFIEDNRNNINHHIKDSIYAKESLYSYQNNKHYDFNQQQNSFIFPNGKDYIKDSSAIISQPDLLNIVLDIIDSVEKQFKLKTKNNTNSDIELKDIDNVNLDELSKMFLREKLTFNIYNSRAKKEFNRKVVDEALPNAIKVLMYRLKNEQNSISETIIGKELALDSESAFEILHKLRNMEIVEGNSIIYSYDKLESFYNEIKENQEASLDEKQIYALKRMSSNIYFLTITNFIHESSIKYPLHCNISFEDVCQNIGIDSHSDLARNTWHTLNLQRVIDFGGYDFHNNPSVVITKEMENEIHSARWNERFKLNPSHYNYQNEIKKHEETIDMYLSDALDLIIDFIIEGKQDITSTVFKDAFPITPQEACALMYKMYELKIVDNGHILKDSEHVKERLKSMPKTFIIEKDGFVISFTFSFINKWKFEKIIIEKPTTNQKITISPLFKNDFLDGMYIDDSYNATRYTRIVDYREIDPDDDTMNQIIASFLNIGENIYESNEVLVRNVEDKLKLHFSYNKQKESFIQDFPKKDIEKTINPKPIIFNIELSRVLSKIAYNAYQSFMAEIGSRTDNEHKKLDNINLDLKDIDLELRKLSDWFEEEKRGFNGYDYLMQEKENLGDSAVR